jgi:hypothetical protein
LRRLGINFVGHIGLGPGGFRLTVIFGRVYLARISQPRLGQRAIRLGRFDRRGWLGRRRLDRSQHD